MPTNDVAMTAGLRKMAVKRLVVRETSPVALHRLAKNFESELHVFSRFRHPNIIRLVGYTLQPERCLLFERGEMDLYAALNNDHVASTNLTWDIRLMIADGIAKAISYLHCHKRGSPVFHRDIKSANVILMANFSPRLIDCGLAKYVQDETDIVVLENRERTQTATNVRFGTSGYTCTNYDKTGK